MAASKKVPKKKMSSNKKKRAVKTSGAAKQTQESAIVIDIKNNIIDELRTNVSENQDTIQNLYKENDELKRLANEKEVNLKYLLSENEHIKKAFNKEKTELIDLNEQKERNLEYLIKEKSILQENLLSKEQNEQKLNAENKFLKESLLSDVAIIKKGFDSLKNQFAAEYNLVKETILKENYAIKEELNKSSLRNKELFELVSEQANTISKSNDFIRAIDSQLKLSHEQNSKQIEKALHELSISQANHFKNNNQQNQVLFEEITTLLHKQLKDYSKKAEEGINEQANLKEFILSALNTFSEHIKKTELERVQKNNENDSLFLEYTNGLSENKQLTFDLTRLEKEIQNLNNLISEREAFLNSALKSISENEALISVINEEIQNTSLQITEEKAKNYYNGYHKLREKQQKIFTLRAENEKLKTAIQWYQDTYEHRRIRGIVKDRIFNIVKK
jgi:hypothetical protein